ncbi:MAG: M23 family metallopeptidase [Oscillospiraceae bacterium]|nr:M23 family metallopeptidase [Oscillospiraceae bacterium]
MRNKISNSRQHKAIYESLNNFQNSSKGVNVKTKCTGILQRYPPSVYIGLLCASLIVIMSLTLFAISYSQAYEVNIEGKPIAVVENTAAVEKAVMQAELQVKEILGKEYTMEKSIDINARMVKRDQIVQSDELAAALIDQVETVEQSYILKIDGEIIAANDSKTAIEAVLEDLKVQYTNDATVEVDFTKNIEITYDYVSAQSEKDISTITDILSANTEDGATYTAVKGDTYSQIASNHGMKLSELMFLNPQASLDRLMVGDILNIKKEIPFLPVKTVDKVSYTEDVDSPVKYIDDSSLYIGDSKIVTQGTKGEASIQALITKVNGMEESKVILQNTSITEPTATVVAKGTTPRPKTASYGTYLWPVSGTVTSGTGNRYLFGTTNYHSGLDIAAPYGTTVKASDGGKVTFSGWKGDYGNLVIITHDNGTQTYYAHNSSLLVSKGEKVYQGQAIAKVGSTGRTTGNHSHFEVRVGGSIKNPYSYLV